MQQVHDKDQTSAPSAYVRLPILARHLGLSISGTRKLIARRVVPVYKPTPRLILARLNEVDAAMARYRTGGSVA